MASPEQLILELMIPEQRENALLDLSKVGKFVLPLKTCVTSTAFSAK